ncbi:MAG: hypothetical protein R3F36_02840 [Candidatus Competibacteraceae bacterium]
MEAIRKIQTVENGEVHLRLPEQFWGQEVEIIVLSAPQEDSQRVATGRSLRGCLKQYAKPELISQEQHTPGKRRRARNMSLVDANVVLRYLLDDHAELSAKATEIIELQAVTLPMEAACEVVYVLQKVYAVERKDIQRQLGALLNETLVNMEKPAVFLKRA